MMFPLFGTKYMDLLSRCLDFFLIIYLFISLVKNWYILCLKLFKGDFTGKITLDANWTKKALLVSFLPKWSPGTTDLSADDSHKPSDGRSECRDWE